MATELDITQMPTGQLSAAVLLDWQDGDPADGNYFMASGREVILARNTSETDSASVIVAGVALPISGRTEDYELTIPALSERVLPMFSLQGWMQQDGSVQLECSSDDLQLAVIRLPL